MSQISIQVPYTQERVIELLSIIKGLPRNFYSPHSIHRDYPGCQTINGTIYFSTSVGEGTISRENGMLLAVLTGASGEGSERAVRELEIYSHEEWEKIKLRGEYRKSLNGRPTRVG